MDDTKKPVNPESAMTYHADSDHKTALLDILKVVQDPHKLYANESLQLYIYTSWNPTDDRDDKLVQEIGASQMQS